MADVPIARPATSGLLPMWQKGFIGSLGGLVAVVTKLLALDAVVLATLLSADEFTKAASLKAMIFIQAPLLMFLGAVIACMMDESVRMKVFAIGVSAPALIAPWLAQPVAGLPTNKAAEIEALFFPPAVAQDIADADSSSRINGLKYILGLDGGETRRFWVVIGSYKQADVALRKAAEVNESAPDLQAFVGERQIGNEYYPLIVGGPSAYLPYEKAKKLKNYAISKLGLSSDGAYFSDYNPGLPRQKVK